MENNYKPISCSFYDELEALATLRRPCRIVFSQGDKVRTIKEGVIRDLFIREGAEYLRLSDGLDVRLDRLVSVDGKKLGDYQ